MQQAIITFPLLHKVCSPWIQRMFDLLLFSLLPVLLWLIPPFPPKFSPVFKYIQFSISFVFLENFYSRGSNLLQAGLVALGQFCSIYRSVSFTASLVVKVGCSDKYVDSQNRNLFLVHVTIPGGGPLSVGIPHPCDEFGTQNFSSCKVTICWVLVIFCIQPPQRESEGALSLLENSHLDHN